MNDYYGNDKATLGDRITAAREGAGLSTRDFAARLGVQHRTMLAWENDEKEPRANRLSMIAGLTGVGLGWLIQGEGTGPDHDTPALSHDARIDELRALRVALGDITKRLGLIEKSLKSE